MVLIGPWLLAAQAQEPIRLTFLGEARLPTGQTLEGTEIGGLSALVYDEASDRYLALADDPDRGGARFYSLEIDLSDGALDPGDVRFLAVTPIRPEPDRKAFTGESLDPEGLALSEHGTLYLSSEGHARSGTPPFVGEMSRDGRLARRFRLPRAFQPGPSRGIRHNQGFESLTRLPSGFLVTATEGPLRQDGPELTPERGGTVRLLVYDPATGRPTREHRHAVGPVALAPETPDTFHTNGLVELLAVDDTTLLALERSYTAGLGNVIRLYSISLDAESTGSPLRSSSPVDLGAALGLDMDNVEGMTWGPRLPDGRRTLVMISDDNFNPEQVTQILAFAVE